MAIPVSTEDLLLIIGELHVENRMLRRELNTIKQVAEDNNGQNNGVSSGAWGMGEDEPTSPTGSAMLSPTMQQKISRQSSQREAPER